MRKTTFLFLITFFFIAATAQKRKINHTDIWANGQFYPKTINGINSLQNGTHYTTLEKNGVIEYDYIKGEPTSTIVEGQYDEYELSSDESMVLLAQNSQSIYRHSFLASYTVYNRKNKNFISIFEGKPIQEPEFSPTGDKVAFVYENNIYYQDLKTNTITQITKDGEKNKIINGITDWVYEEEFGFVRAYEWNQAGTQIVFIRFDESEVKEVNLPIYEGGNYPSEMKFKYPKAGEKNSTVSLKVYTLPTDYTSTLDLKQYNDFYIPKIQYSSKGLPVDDLFVFVSNRHQNKLDVLKVNSKNLSSKVLFTETDKAWIDTDNIKFKTTPEGIIWKSDRDNYSHLYLIDYNTGTVKKQLTKGNYNVTEFYGENNSKIYYQSTEDGSINRSVYYTDIKSGTKVKLSEKTGNNEASFSSNYNYFINTLSTANSPFHISLNDGKSGKEIKVLEDNSRVKNTLQQYDISSQEFTTFKLSNGVEVNAWMIKPINMVSGKKYPVLMYVYGGPGHQTVKNEWGWSNYFWFQQLAEMGYIVVSVDGRGTGGKEASFKKATYKQLGKLEIEDQIEAAKYLQQLDYVDANRIGIFGWSFGGYMTSLAMTKGNGLFKMGIAVAPVTNWRFYDTVYTERFLQTPEENSSGYDDNSPINFAQQLQGKYLLIHGTADDNVHYQNTMLMAEALVQANKDFDMHSYTDKNHGIYGGYTRLHLYKKMTDYIINNL